MFAVSQGIELGFWTHFKFCGWTTVMISAVGCLVIFYIGRPMIELLDP